MGVREVEHLGDDLREKFRFCLTEKDERETKKRMKRSVGGEYLSNLTREEKKGLKSLKKKIDEGMITIAQTDKSARLAVLSPDQYIKAGLEHASKDIEITWKEVRYMQNQTNTNVWWLSEIIGYSANKNKELGRSIL